MIDALVDGVTDHIFRCRVINRAIDARERHAAKPDRRDRQSPRAQRAMLEPFRVRHGCLPLIVPALPSPTR